MPGPSKLQGLVPRVQLPPSTAVHRVQETHPSRLGYHNPVAPRSAVTRVTKTAMQSHRRGDVEGRGASNGPTVTVFRGFQSQLTRQAKRLKPLLLDVCIYISRGHIAKDSDSFSALCGLGRVCVFSALFALGSAYIIPAAVSC
jgi:hypothetical protein